MPLRLITHRLFFRVLFNIKVKTKELMSKIYVFIRLSRALSFFVTFLYLHLRADIYRMDPTLKKLKSANNIQSKTKTMSLKGLKLG